MIEVELTASGEVPKRRKVPRDPAPRFRPSHVEQLDALRGCAEEQVPREHLARDVWRVVEKIDTSELEREYSALGRRGYHPRRLLAVWVYASLIGMHHSTQVERACKTDAAFRWLCGGDSPSGPTLRRMRMKQGAFFASALEQTIRIGAALDLVHVDALAVDSVRIRAHASNAAVRTKSRSAERLQELALVDVGSMSNEQRTAHEAKVRKHRAALQECAARMSASIVVTNEAAALMKFPSGASAPAHRTTVVASGVSSRFVVAVLVDRDPTDYGKLAPAVLEARQVLERAGVIDGQMMLVSADAGYFSARDLAFAEQSRDWADILIAEAPRGGRGRHFFGREQFTIGQDAVAVCPAGKRMLGPYANDKLGKTLKWVGVGCESCALKPRCTAGRVRSIELDAAQERARRAMLDRLAQPDAQARYNRRIATVEPVFSFLQHAMGFRRSSSRAEPTVKAELLLKLLAYNIDRIIRAERTKRKLLCVYFLLDTEF
jgi:transposase